MAKVFRGSNGFVVVAESDAEKLALGAIGASQLRAADSGVDFRDADGSSVLAAKTVGLPEESSGGHGSVASVPGGAQIVSKFPADAEEINALLKNVAPDYVHTPATDPDFNSDHDGYRAYILHVTGDPSAAETGLTGGDVQCQTFAGAGDSLVNLLQNAVASGLYVTDFGPIDAYDLQTDPGGQNSFVPKGFHFEGGKRVRDAA